MKEIGGNKLNFKVSLAEKFIDELSDRYQNFDFVCGWLEYCCNNPVKGRRVRQMSDEIFSSFGLEK